MKVQIIGLLSARLQRIGYGINHISVKELVVEKGRTYGIKEEIIEEFLEEEAHKRTPRHVGNACKAHFVVNDNGIEITYEILDDFIGSDLKNKCKMEVYTILDNILGYTKIRKRITKQINQIKKLMTRFLVINELRYFASWSTSILFVGILFILIAFCFPGSMLRADGPFIYTIKESVDGQISTHGINLSVWLLNLLVAFFALSIHLALRIMIEKKLALHLIAIDKKIGGNVSSEYKPFYRNRILQDLGIRPRPWSKYRFYVLILVALIPAFVALSSYNALTVMLYSPLIFFLFCYLSDYLISSFNLPSKPRGSLYDKARLYSFTLLGLPAFMWTLLLYNSYIDMKELSVQFLGSPNMKIIIFCFLYSVYLGILLASLLLFIFSKSPIRTKPKAAIKSMISIAIVLIASGISMPRPKIDPSKLGLSSLEIDVALQVSVFLADTVTEIMFLAMLEVIPIALLLVAFSVSLWSTISERSKLRKFTKSFKELRVRKLLHQFILDFAEEVLVPVVPFPVSIAIFSLSTFSLGMFVLPTHFLFAFLFLQVLIMIGISYARFKMSQSFQVLT